MMSWEMGLILILCGLMGIYLSRVFAGCEPCGEHIISTFTTLMFIGTTITGILFCLYYILIVLGVI